MPSQLRLHPTWVLESRIGNLVLIAGLGWLVALCSLDGKTVHREAAAAHPPGPDETARRDGRLDPVAGRDSPPVSRWDANWIEVGKAGGEY